MPPTSLKTKCGTPRLSDLARRVVAPVGVTSTGWPAVHRTCAQKLGIEFDPWQIGAGRLILAKRDDDNLAAMIDGVGMSIPRQVGKTYLVSAIVFALCVNTPGLLVIWTAHHLKTSGETFLALQAFAQRQRVAPHVRQVFTGSGDEEIRFHNGSRILFGARERGFGRGIPGVDVLIFDEAQILSDRALANMLATMNTSRFGLHLYIGTPPKPDDLSESFKRMRREALAGTLTDGAWVEFGAEPDADLDDHAQWRKANPSYPKRTPMQSLLRLKRKLLPEDWRREGMGIWDEDQPGSRLITATEWDETALEQAPDGVPSFGVAFSMNGSRVSVCGSRKHEGGVHVELIGAHSGPLEQGVAEMADWLVERRTTAATIVISGKSGASALSQALRDRGLPKSMIHVASTPDYLASCSMFYDAIRDRTVTHWRSDGQAALDTSVSVCDKKRRGVDGSWSWEATTVGGDETPIEAAGLALFGARTTKRRPGRKSVGRVMA